MLAALGGDKEKLVIDLSCRKKGDTWFVAMNKWQTITDMEVTQGIKNPNFPFGIQLNLSRIYKIPRAILLRVPGPRCRQRRSSKRY